MAIEVAISFFVGHLARSSKPAASRSRRSHPSGVTDGERHSERTMSEMERWTPPEVLAAAKAVDGAWPLPSGIETVQTDGYSVLFRPGHLTSPTSGRVQAWVNWPRLFSEIRPEVEHLARERGEEEVWWWTGDPSGSAVEEDLRSVGAHLVVTQLVMARPLEGSTPTPGWTEASHRA